MSAGDIETYLKSVLPRKALVAMVARKRLDGKMDSLVSLQIMVPVEALWALVTLEWTVVGGRLLMLMSHEVWHGCSVSTVEARHHGRMSTNEC